VKFVLFIVFIRIASHFNSDALLNQFILFSLVTGCFMSINQTEIKRLLAYSSIVHVGFLLMGDIPSSLVYLFTYLLSSLIIFSVLLSAELGGREIVYLNDLKFLRGSGHFNIGCLVIAFASSAGLPPFAGFYGKFLVWSSLIEDIYLTNSLDSYSILFLSIAISLITIYYYMRLIAYLFIGQDSQKRAASSVVTESSAAHRSLVALQITSCVLVIG
jgi:NADH-quinone oxidoreductase subunit N